MRNGRWVVEMVARVWVRFVLVVLVVTLVVSVPGLVGDDAVWSTDTTGVGGRLVGV